MMGESVASTALFVACAVLFLASVIGILRILKPCRLLARMKTMFSSACEMLASFQAESANELELLVQMKMQKLKVDHVRWCFRACCVFAAPMAVTEMYKLQQGNLHDHSLAQDAIYVLMHGLFAAVLNCPAIVSWKTVDVFIGSFAVLVAGYASPWVSRPNTAMVSIVTATCITILLNTVRRSVVTSAVCNLLVAIAVTSTTIIHGQTLFNRAWVLAALELIILVVFPAFAYTLDVIIERGIRNGLHVQAAKEVHAAATALLRSCCDLMVELDSEGAIVSSTQDLGSFLLRGRGVGSKGSKLSELFALEEDREKFLDKLHAPERSSAGLAEAIHVQMKDGNNELLRVELMWFGFRHLDGVRHFMVGLREFSDLSREDARSLRRRRQALAEGCSPESSVASFHCEYSEEPPSEPSESREVGTSSSTGSMELNAGSSTSLQVASITVDATVTGMPVQSHSRGFRSRIGRVPPRTHFLDRVRRRADLVRWIHTAMYAASIGSEVPEHKVVLNMQQGLLKATCRIALEPGQEFPALDRVELVFSNIRPCSGQSRGSHDAGSGISSHLRGTPVGRIRL